MFLFLKVLRKLRNFFFAQSYTFDSAVVLLLGERVTNEEKIDFNDTLLRHARVCDFVPGKFPFGSVKQVRQRGKVLLSLDLVNDV